MDVLVWSLKFFHVLLICCGVERHDVSVRAERVVVLQTIFLYCI